MPNLFLGWGSINHYLHLEQNPTKRLKAVTLTPEEAWSGKSPTVSHFRIFASLYLKYELEQS
jgi:hypothetical protein